MKISLILLIIVPAIIIPVIYLDLFQRQNSSELLLLTLNLKIPPPPEEKSADFPINITGSAVSVPITMNYTDFMILSNFSGYVTVKGKINGVPFENNNSYEGIPFRRIIYDIANVTSYSSVTVQASDNYYMTFRKTDIDNPEYWADLILAYKMNGENLTNYDYYKPVYCLVDQHYTITKYADDWNAQWCVRHVVIFQINS